MTNFHRRIIYSIFIALFFIITPLILLYSSGYRFNFKKNILQKTGIVFLETKPEKVNIWFNNKMIADHKTPVRIKNILPNEYNLKITKDGYSSWEKSINVYEGQTTNIQYVRLFKINPEPELLLAKNIIQIIPNRKQDKFLLLSQEKDQFLISVFNLDNNNEEPIFITPNQIKNLNFIDNDDRIALYLADDILIVNLSDKEVISLTKEFNRSLPLNLKLDQFNSNYFYYLQNDDLYQFNLATKANKLIMAGQITDFIQSNDQLYFITNSSLNKAWINKININSQANHLNLFSLDINHPYKLDSINNNILILKDSQNNNLLLWDEYTKTEEIIKGVEYYSWNNNYDEILFGNTQELWVYKINQDKNKGSYTLLTRLSDAITEASWYNPGTHIFYLVNDQIKFTENLDSDRFTGNLISLAKIKNLIINKKGDLMYFLAEYQNKFGLYKIAIQ